MKLKQSSVESMIVRKSVVTLNAQFLLLVQLIL